MHYRGKHGSYIVDKLKLSLPILDQLDKHIKIFHCKTTLQAELKYNELNDVVKVKLS